MFGLHLAQALLIFSPAALCAVDINDYFNVKDGNEDVGGCGQSYGSKSGQEWLKTWFSEAETLTNTAVNAINSYGDQESSRENLLIYMGILPDSTGKSPSVDTKFQQVKDNFHEMQNWFARPPSDKGWIFCSAHWLQLREQTDELEYEESSDSGSDTAMTGVDEETTKAKAKVGDRWPVKGRDKVYWSPDFKEYLVSKPNQATEFCDDKNNNFGATIDPEKVEPGWMTICMSRVFSAGGGVNTLGATEPTPNVLLADVMSKGVTLYHELFHWVLTNDKTKDTISNLNGVLTTAARQTKSKGKKNAAAWLPESLSTFAEAQWISEQQWSNSALGQRWGWTGKAEADPKPLPEAEPKSEEADSKPEEVEQKSGEADSKSEGADSKPEAETNQKPEGDE